MSIQSSEIIALSKSFDVFDFFQPHRDEHAAIKFSLREVLSEDRIADLMSLSEDAHKIGGIAGEPGWLIERRDSAVAEGAKGYELWPHWACFRATVDPDSFLLAYPEQFMSGEYFYSYLCEVLESYIRAVGAETDAAATLLAAVREKRQNWSLGRNGEVTDR